jgi:hypothetical protein
MLLRGRYNHEIPIELFNSCKSKIYGIPENLEV